MYIINISDENVIGLSLQEILPDNNNIKAEKMLVANPPNILKRSKSLKVQNAVSNLLFCSSLIFIRNITGIYFRQLRITSSFK